MNDELRCALARVKSHLDAAPHGFYMVHDRKCGGIGIIQLRLDRRPLLIAQMNPALGREAGIALAQQFAWASMDVSLLFYTLTDHLGDPGS